MRKSMANFNTYVHRGQNVVSSKAFNRKDANTDAQQLQRACFKLTADFYQSMGGFIDAGFPVRPERYSPYNFFMYLNMPNAIDTSGDAPALIYEKLQLAKGSLAAVNVMTTSLGDAGLTLGCESNQSYPYSSADDVIMVLVKAKNGALYAKRQPRGSEENWTVTVTLPKLLAADIECVFLFATTADGKKASNTVYVPLIG
ncbi:DUF6266 family protein [Parabacteroides sp. FAFU027]|uniref:DUF6266 family protein n=1 Tax=Parabacteroides sp. FAFU027 TaxID=2922715 RepID=UPI001FAF47D8|nr:DUF6266 family protein [Parabacteroides sp. FAFU027]